VTNRDRLSLNPEVSRASREEFILLFPPVNAIKESPGDAGGIKGVLFQKKIQKNRSEILNGRLYKYVV